MLLDTAAHWTDFIGHRLDRQNTMSRYLLALCEMYLVASPQSAMTDEAR